MLPRVPDRLRPLAIAAVHHGLNLATLAEAAASRFPDREALVGEKRRFTFAELWRAAEATAAGLYLHVLGKRPRLIALQADDEMLVVNLLAAHRLGLDVMPVSPEFGRDELRGIIPKDALIVYGESAPEWHPGPAIAAERLAELAATSGTKLARTRRRSRVILLSSGRQGQPRAHVTRPIGVGGARQLNSLRDRIGIRGDDRVLAGAPLFHGHGLQLLACTLFAGAALVSPGPLAPRDVLEVMRREQISVASGTPAQAEAIVRELDAGATVPPLRSLICSSAPLTPELVERLIGHWGPIVQNAYGMAETGTVAMANPEQVMRHPGTVGTPLSGVAIGVVGERYGRDAQGQLWVRGGSRTVITSDYGRIEDGLVYVDQPAVAS